MSKYTFLGLAAILLGAGNAAKYYADSAEEPADPSDNPDPSGEPAKRRGRPPGSTNKPAETPAAGPCAPADAPDDGEARLNANKALIKPLLDDGKGAEVKAIVAKYSKTGLKDLPASSQAAFEKDIEGASI